MINFLIDLEFEWTARLLRPAIKSVDSYFSIQFISACWAELTVTLFMFTVDEAFLDNCVANIILSYYYYYYFLPEVHSFTRA